MHTIYKENIVLDVVLWLYTVTNDLLACIS
jgi:hypothetical protein